VAAPTNLQTIGISFLNDAYGGWSGADRNLYVDHIVANGVTLTPDQGWFQDTANQTSAGSAALVEAGTLNWGAGLLGSAVTAPSPSPAPTPNMLSVSAVVAGDAYLGDPQMALM